MSNLGRVTNPSIPMVIADHEQRLRAVEVPIGGRFQLKVTGDDEAVTVGDNQLAMIVPLDLDKTWLVAAEAGVTTPGGSVTTVQVRNIDQAVDMLTTPITIDAGETTSYTAAVPGVLLELQLHVGDRVTVDVDTAGSGALGLTVWLWYARN